MREGAVNIRPEVERFAELMEWKLRANDHKPGFHLMSLRNIIERMREEAMELLAEGQRESSLDEAIDVANFAAFGYSKIAQRVQEQGPGGEL